MSNSTLRLFPTIVADLLFATSWRLANTHSSRLLRVQDLQLARMDSKSTYSSYKRYKANTDAVAIWLLTTAKKHGCLSYDSNDSSPAASAAVPRLKGKSRRLAREADAAAAKQARLRPAAYRIEIKDFIQLAQFIAKSTTPRIKVPDHTVRDLQQAIKMRKSHQAWLAMFPSQTDSAAANQAHTYFIRTLEVVMEILRPNMPERFRPKPAQNGIDAKESQLANIFEHLTVDEPSEAGASDTDTRREDPVENISVTVSDAVDDEKLEAIIASIYLSRDSHGFLEDIQEVWIGYQQGSIDLMAAAITTNTAMEFCRKLQEEFEATFPKQEGVHERGCPYCLYLQATNGEVRDSRYRSGTCWTAAREVLSKFTDAIKDVPRDAAPGVSPEQLPLYAEGSDHSAMDDSERLNQDLGIAYGMLPEFFALIHASSQVQAEHELFRGLRQLMVDKERPFWLTFSFQIYLNIRHILREGVDQGFQDLCREGQLIKMSIDRSLDFHRKMGVQGPANKVLRQLSDTIADWVERDRVSTIVDVKRVPLDPTSEEHIPANYHLERDPLWCGLLLYNFRMAAHEGAIFAANFWTFTLTAAHLYNILRQTRILSYEWPDMERIFTMHGVKSLFVGDMPTTFANGMKGFGLAIGMPTSILAKKPRRRLFDHPQTKSRKSLGMLAPVLRKFKSSISDGVRRGALGPDDIRGSCARKSWTKAAMSA